jgi:nucleoside-diphosphate-sugar epimerase
MTTAAVAPRLFCFGLGYSALALGRRLAARGWRIAGTTRSADKAAALAREGTEAFVFTGDRPMAGAEAALSGATHLLQSIAPDEAGDPALRHHAAAIADCRTLRWIGYLSTTGVYGDHGGAWVDEATPCRPVSARGRRRLEAEAAWLDLGAAHGIAVQVFRLGGIYGPGRSALDTVRAGRARRIDKPGQVFSRTNVEDLATVLAASMGAPRPGRVYNVVDDEPGPPGDVIAYACDLLGVAPPPVLPFHEADLSPMGRSFYGENKRVSNRRIKHELGVALAYPTYREGLDALFARERAANG